MTTPYVVKEAPILDEHTLTDDDGNPVIDLTEAHLRKIAARNNRRMHQTGDLIPVTIGHTTDDSPEHQQPPIVGWASHLTVRPFGRTGKKAIYAKFRVPRDKVHLVNQYPRRSIELWLSDWKIDPISLLGATTPERDLGLLRFAADGRRKYKRTLSSTPMDEQALVKAVVAALQETDVWKFAEAQMKKQEGEGAPSEGEPVGPDNMDDEELETLLGEDGDEGLHEDELSDLEHAEGDIEEEEEKEGEEPLRMSAGSPAAPSGSNTFTPSGGRIGRNDRQRMQRDGLRIRMSRLEAAVTNTQKENKALRLKLQRKEREADLIQLEAEGLDLDRSEELELVADMPETLYRKHLATMRKRYRRAPVAGRMPNFGDPSVSRTRSAGRTKEHAMEVAEYARSKGLSYEDALEQYNSNKTA